MVTEDGGVIVERDGDFTSITSAQGLPGDNVVKIEVCNFVVIIKN